MHSALGDSVAVSHPINKGQATMNATLTLGLLTTVLFALTGTADAQPATGIPPAITTPDKVETRIGTLEYKDGAPTAATA